MPEGSTREQIKLKHNIFASDKGSVTAFSTLLNLLHDGCLYFGSLFQDPMILCILSQISSNRSFVFDKPCSTKIEWILVWTCNNFKIFTSSWGVMQQMKCTFKGFLYSPKCCFYTRSNCSVNRIKATHTNANERMKKDFRCIIV